MEHEDLRRFQSIERCHAILQREKFPGAAVELATRRLADIYAKLDTLRERERSARGLIPWDGKEIRKRCRNLRKEFISPIAKAAYALDGFMTFAPGAAEALKVPRLKDSPALHVAAGERVLRFMKDHARNFLKETGLDRDTFTKLRAATRELRIQSTFVHSTRAERTGLIREIKALLTAGRRQIEFLKSQLEPHLIQRELVNEWAKAHRVGAKKGRPKDTPEQRAEKRLQAAQRKKERLEQQRLRREQRKEARRAQRARRANKT